MESIEKHETCNPLNMIIEPLNRNTKKKYTIFTLIVFGSPLPQNSVTLVRFPQTKHINLVT